MLNNVDIVALKVRARGAVVARIPLPLLRGQPEAWAQATYERQRDLYNVQNDTIVTVRRTARRVGARGS